LGFEGFDDPVNRKVIGDELLTVHLADRHQLQPLILLISIWLFRHHCERPWTPFPIYREMGPLCRENFPMPSPCGCDGRQIDFAAAKTFNML
jgi:hypothetical protein